MPTLNIPFTIPDQKDEYMDCVFGSLYKKALFSLVKYLIEKNPSDKSQEELLKDILLKAKEVLEKEGLYHVNNGPRAN